MLYGADALLRLPRSEQERLGREFRQSENPARNPQNRSSAVLSVMGLGSGGAIISQSGVIV
jgi:hypothetical protein